MTTNRYIITISRQAYKLIDEPIQEIKGYSEINVPSICADNKFTGDTYASVSLSVVELQQLVAKYGTKFDIHSPYNLIELIVKNSSDEVTEKFMEIMVSTYKSPMIQNILTTCLASKNEFVSTKIASIVLEQISVLTSADALQIICRKSDPDYYLDLTICVWVKMDENVKDNLIKYMFATSLMPHIVRGSAIKTYKYLISVNQTYIHTLANPFTHLYSIYHNQLEIADVIWGKMQNINNADVIRKSISGNDLEFSHMLIHMENKDGFAPDSVDYLMKFIKNDQIKVTDTTLNSIIQFAVCYDNEYLFDNLAAHYNLTSNSLNLIEFNVKTYIDKYSSKLRKN